MTELLAPGPACDIRGDARSADPSRSGNGPVSGSAGRNASMRNRVMVSPDAGSGAQGRSRPPWITICHQTCRSSGAICAAQETTRCVIASSFGIAPTCANAIRCTSAARPSRVRSGDTPCATIESASVNSAGPSPATSASSSPPTSPRSAAPTISRTDCASTWPAPWAIA